VTRDYIAIITVASRGVKIPSYVEMIDIYGKRGAAGAFPQRSSGSVLNTYDMDESAAREAPSRARQRETGLPATDPVRF